MQMWPRVRPKRALHFALDEPLLGVATKARVEQCSATVFSVVDHYSKGCCLLHYIYVTTCTQYDTNKIVKLLVQAGNGLFNHAFVN